MAAESGGEYFYIKRLTRTAQPKTKVLLSKDRGWNLKTGIPSPEKLKALGLDFIKVQ